MCADAARAGARAAAGLERALGLGTDPSFVIPVIFTYVDDGINAIRRRLPVRPAEPYEKIVS